MSIFERLEAREAQDVARNERMWRRMGIAAFPLLWVVFIILAAMELKPVWPFVWTNRGLHLEALRRVPASDLASLCYLLAGFSQLAIASLQITQDKKNKKFKPVVATLYVVWFAAFCLWTWLPTHSYWGVWFVVGMLSLVLIAGLVWGDIGKTKRRGAA
jgi:hypothetical protein